MLFLNVVCYQSQQIRMKRYLSILLLILVACEIFGAPRSPEWGRVRREHLEAHPTCAVCGSGSDIEVHHIKPFHLFPELELDPGNLVTLCESKNYGFNDHLVVGHGGNYRFYNPWVMDDIKELKRIRDKYRTFGQAEEEINEYVLFIKATVRSYNYKEFGNGCDR